MYSLLDIEIHYNGWTQAEAASFLKAFGIEDSAVVSEIYQYILETPGNYLKYYWGYLSFWTYAPPNRTALARTLI